MSTSLFPELTEPQYGINFPLPLAEKYRPTRIADFAGLNEVKKILAGFLRAPANCGFLFVGPAGTGKTSMGLALATELRAYVHHAAAQECTVEAVRKLAWDCNYYPPAGYTRHLVLIDEADLMSSAAQNAILSKLDGTDPLPDTVWVFTCNAIDRLQERFLSRNKVLHFSTYGIQAEAAKLLDKVWTTEAPRAEKPNFARMIKEETGNVRAALMSLEMKLLAV